MESNLITYAIVIIFGIILLTSWRELMNLTRELTHRRNVVGLDLIAPALKDDQSLFCAKLLYKILGAIF